MPSGGSLPGRFWQNQAKHVIQDLRNCRSENSAHDANSSPLLLSTKFFTDGILHAYLIARRILLFKSPTNRVNIDESRQCNSTLHQFCITGLWTACTRLKSQKLETAEIH